MAKCMHRNASYVWHRQPDGSERGISRFCDDCGATLSMGPARDDMPGVAIEIRAAELAANGYPIDDAARIALSWSEMIGWDAFGADRDFPRGGGPAAGWLAHAIVVHDQFHHAVPDLVELDVVAGAEPEQGIEVPVAVSTDVDVPPGWSEDLDAMERGEAPANEGAA